MNNLLDTTFRPANIPTLSSSAMLTVWKVSMPPLTKKDRRASRKAEEAAGADAGVAQLTKTLLGDCAEFKAVKDYAANARNKHYRLTMPWIDNGPRLISTQQYADHVGIMTAEKQTIEDLWYGNFVPVYDFAVAQQQIRMGDLFNPLDYPTSEALNRKFGVSIQYMPIAERGDWRTDLEGVAADKIATQYDEFTRDALGNMQTHIWENLKETLTKLHRQLGKNDEGKNNKLYDSVFDRAIELLDLMKSCNFTGDVHMENVRQDLLAAFHDAGKPLNLQQIKASPTLREETHKNISKTIAALPSLDLF
jgi:hypothetical protein|tara:strand:+ start:2178 stop:3098 length:921 start_codon:yes stop_codon:yes gene_type:complete